MKILIKNIKELVQVETNPVLKVSGKEMAELNTLRNAWLSIDGDKISDFGSMDDCFRVGAIRTHIWYLPEAVRASLRIGSRA